MAFTFPKSRRLTRKAEFDAVFRLRHSRGDSNLVVYAAPNEYGYPRLGLVVSRKVSKSAVDRNRWKRLLREAFRLVQSELPAVDLVCLPKTAASPELDSLKASLVKLAHRAMRPKETRHPRKSDPTSTANSG